MKAKLTAIEEAEVAAGMGDRRDRRNALQFVLDGLEHIIDGDGCAVCTANASQAQYLRDYIRQLLDD